MRKMQQGCRLAKMTSRNMPKLCLFRRVRITFFRLNGSFVNLAYPMPCGSDVKLLDDRDIYLGNQVECEFNDGELIKCFGLVAGMDFLLVSEYGANCTSPEIVVYKKR